VVESDEAASTSFSGTGLGVGADETGYKATQGIEDCNQEQGYKATKGIEDCNQEQGREEELSQLPEIQEGNPAKECYRHWE
jgi:hypothetical protein